MEEQINYKASMGTTGDNKLIDIEKMSDEELIKVVNDLQQPFIPEDSIVRKLCIQYYGKDNVEKFILLQMKLLPIVAGRLEMYKKSYK